MGSRLFFVLAIAVASAGIGFYVSTIANDAVDQQDEVVTQLEDISSDSTAAPSTTSAGAADADAVPSPDTDDDFPALTTDAVRAAADRGSPVPLQFTIVETLTHDTDAFTQGLEIDDGRLFESTGLVGRSSIRELDLDSGDVLRQEAVPDVFAEGLTVLDDSAIQLTWQDGVAYRYDAETFEVTDTYAYEGEGWGLCDNGTELVMSNGTPTLAFRDTETFELLSSVEVTLSGSPVSMLNELECVDGLVWANIWQSSLIVHIDPDSGDVVGVLNAQTLTPPAVADDANAVLNGIAYDPTNDTFLLTGKLWPSIFRVRIEPESQ